MRIVLDHLIVRARDKERSARFFASLLGLEPGAPAGPFVPVRVNERLTFDFDDREAPTPGHYAFVVDAATLEHAVAYAASAHADFGSGRTRGWDGAVDRQRDRSTVYVRDPDGHSYELIVEHGAT